MGKNPARMVSFNANFLQIFIWVENRHYKEDSLNLKSEPNPKSFC